MRGPRDGTIAVDPEQLKQLAAAAAAHLAQQLSPPPARSPVALPPPPSLPPPPVLPLPPPMPLLPAPMPHAAPQPRPMMRAAPREGDARATAALPALLLHSPRQAEPLCTRERPWKELSRCRALELVVDEYGSNVDDPRVKDLLEETKVRI